MTKTGTMETTIPIKLLFEAVKQIVTVELQTGDKYRGELIEAEPNMSIQLSSVTHTQKNGQVKKLELVYLRGSQIKFFVLPQILEDAPLFKKVGALKKKYDKLQHERKRTERRGKPTERKR